jgi:heme exporter protein C
MSRANLLFGFTSVFMLLLSSYLSLVSSPIEKTQGIHQKIFYLHVPLAFLAYLAITLVFISSIMYLWKRTAHWDQVARVSAEIGIITTTLVLISGSLWGRPVWGAWWSWSDARLVTTLVMWLIYMAYLMLRSLGGFSEQTAKLGSIIGILGFINVPITYFSVYLWTFLHPLPTLQSSDDRPENSILIPFLLSLFSYILFFLYIGYLRLQIERASDTLKNLKQRVYS